MAKGEEWFWDTLVDADLASNAFNWQWVAGCGADAAPYFRIFNPTLQAIKFDPKGDYIKQWIPELQNTPINSSMSRGEIKPDLKIILSLLSLIKKPEKKPSSISKLIPLISNIDN